MSENHDRDPLEKDERPPVDPALIGPGITLMAIVAMLVVARFYDRLPIHAPACGLLTTTGVPCMACGGTRSMMALAHGRIIEALAFNPLIFLGVIAAFAWAGTSLILWRFFPNRPSRARRLPIWVIVTGLTALFLANWVYLYFYLPR